jgi:parallel beta-helix repeat protein
LLVEDCQAIVVGPNNFDRNPRYDYGNTQAANNSLVFRECRDCILNGLLISNVWRDPAGLTLENCQRCNITNCTVLDCDNVGILLKNAQHCRVSDCLVRDDRPDRKSESLIVVGGRGNLITGNSFGKSPQVPEGSGSLRDN